ncbi:MAG: HAMP domain-containing sensor histidine kinase [bacterium]
MYTVSMILAKKAVVFIVLLLVAALSGLVILQTYLLSYAVDLKQQTFDQNVSTALTSSAQKVESDELTSRVLELSLSLSANDSVAPRLQRIQVTQTDSALDGNIVVRALHLDSLTSLELDHDSYFYERGAISSCDSFVFGGSLETSDLALIWQQDRTGLVHRVLENVSHLAKGPITDRLSTDRLDSLLASSLAEVGIETPYSFGIVANRPDTLLFASADGVHRQLRDSDYRTRLFPLDLLPPSYDLVVFFPATRLLLWKQTWPFFLAAVVFLGVIVYCFVRTIRTIIEQQRFAEMMVGFINNMTHEFKTPISTVALAAEAMAQPELVGDPDTVTRYNRMIRDENDRMRQQVEKILQFASLERGEYELNLSLVDVHEILRQVADSFSLQIDHRGGVLETELTAGQRLLRADPLHLRNIFGNLVDNAVKYSPGTPQIRVTSRDAEPGVAIAVSDRGIGISERHRKRVFDRYYRCPTGNRHDVKGFGLGLSYVQILVAAHGGRVALESRPDHGTTVTVWLPTTATDG